MLKSTKMHAKSNNKKVPIWSRSIDFDYLIISLFSYLFGVLFALNNTSDISWMAIINSFLIILFALIGQAFFNNGIGNRNITLHNQNRNIQNIMLGFISITLSIFIFIIWTLTTKEYDYSKAILIMLLSLAIIIDFYIKNRVLKSGMHELIHAVICAILIPAIAYSYQTTQSASKLLSISTVLFLIILSHFMIRELQFYQLGNNDRPHTFLEIVGWKKGLIIHRFILIGAYIFIAIMIIIKKIWDIGWPILISFPISVLVIIIVLGIERGAKPNWKFLNALSLSTVLFSLYMPSISYLIRSIR